MKKLFCLLVMLLSIKGRSQTILQIDDKVARAISRLDHWENDTSVGKYDSLNAVNNTLIQYFGTALNTQPTTLAAPFTKAKKAGLKFVSSQDKKVRFYWWDSKTGGSMVYFNDIVQHADDKAVHARYMNDTTMEGGDPGFMCKDIVMIQRKDGHKVYMALKHEIASGRMKWDGITAYTITNGLFNEEEVFRTATKQLSEIRYGYDFFLLTDKTARLPGIHFSSDKKVLYIPIVVDDKLTSKNLVYKFDGNNFVFDKNAR